MEFVGIDGCRGGWFSVALNEKDTWRIEIIPSEAMARLQKIFADAKQVLIDMPIGLPDPGMPSRLCDHAARRFLGAAHASSVFPVPTRAAARANSYEAASLVNYQQIGKRLSKQTWNISPKIREIDEILQENPDLKEKILESHPEICLQVLNDEIKLTKSKKKADGQQERLDLLQSIFPQTKEIIEEARQNFLRKDAGIDDVLDALVLALSARMGHENGFNRLPAMPPQDETGLPMQIVYPKI